MPIDKARLRIILREAGITKRAAGRPYIPEVTLKKYRAGEAFMAYFIDQAKNHSKMYEMAVVPDDQRSHDGGDTSGSYTLKKLWGALGQGAKKPKLERNLSYAKAVSLMNTHGRAKLRKGYKDAFKTRPLGQYPVGLDREVGFGWGTQEIVGCVPALRDMSEMIDLALDKVRQGDAPDLLSLLEQMGDTLKDFPKSSMASEIAKLMRPPLQRMKKNPRFIDDPSRAAKELMTMKRYIDRQTRECNL